MRRLGDELFRHSAEVRDGVSSVDGSLLGALGPGLFQLPALYFTVDDVRRGHVPLGEIRVRSSFASGLAPFKA